MAASLSFYRDGLGFPPHNYIEGQDCVMFKLEGTWLALYPRGSLANDASVPSCGCGFPGFALAHNVGSKVLVDETFALAVAGGATPVKKAATRVLGRLFGLLYRSRRFSVGSRLEPVH
jgi:hypothetical protein